MVHATAVAPINPSVRKMLCSTAFATAEIHRAFKLSSESKVHCISDFHSRV